VTILAALQIGFKENDRQMDVEMQKQEIKLKNTRGVITRSTQSKNNQTATCKHAFQRDSQLQDTAYQSACLILTEFVNIHKTASLRVDSSNPKKHFFALFKP
jgi:hypothetical protein